MNMAAQFPRPNGAEPRLGTPRPTTARPDEGQPAASARAVPEHDARNLTHGGVQARILLDGQVYSLRITRAGKLILTK